MEMPLKGAKDKVTKGLDGKTVISAPVSPLVLERAHDYVRYYEQAEDAREKANQAGQDLMIVFKKMKTQRIAKVTSDRRTYTFRPGSVEKLLIEKTQTVK
jgi:hypothetical protein